MSVPGAGGARHIAIRTRESWDLLAATNVGRMACSQGALPSIRVMNHIVDDGLIIVHTRLHSLEGTQIQRWQPAGVVVAYQTDSINAERQCGWSVVVTGLARPVTDLELITRYAARMRPWISQPMDTFVSITAEIISGTRIQPQ